MNDSVCMRVNHQAPWKWATSSVDKRADCLWSSQRRASECTSSLSTCFCLSLLTNLEPLQALLSSHKLGTTTGSSQPPVLRLVWASLVAQTVKNQPAMQETRVQSVGQEDPLKKGMATHSSILAWRTPWTEKSWGLQSLGSQSQKWLSTHDWLTTLC